jgi:hypothetical protein
MCLFKTGLQLPAPHVAVLQVRRQVDDVIDMVDMLELGSSLVGEPGGMM